MLDVRARIHSSRTHASHRVAGVIQHLARRYPRVSAVAWPFSDSK